MRRLSIIFMICSLSWGQKTSLFTAGDGVSVSGSSTATTVALLVDQTFNNVEMDTLTVLGSEGDLIDCEYDVGCSFNHTPDMPDGATIENGVKITGTSAIGINSDPTVMLFLTGNSTPSDYIFLGVNNSGQQGIAILNDMSVRLGNGIFTLTSSGIKNHGDDTVSGMDTITGITHMSGCLIYGRPCATRGYVDSNAVIGVKGSGTPNAIPVWVSSDSVTASDFAAVDNGDGTGSILGNQAGWYLSPVHSEEEQGFTAITGGSDHTTATGGVRYAFGYETTQNGDIVDSTANQSISGWSVYDGFNGGQRVANYENATQAWGYTGNQFVVGIDTATPMLDLDLIGSTAELSASTVNIDDGGGGHVFLTAEFGVLTFPAGFETDHATVDNATVLNGSVTWGGGGSTGGFVCYNHTTHALVVSSTACAGL